MDSLKDPVAEIVHNQPTTEPIDFVTQQVWIYFESPTDPLKIFRK